MVLIMARGRSPNYPSLDLGKALKAVGDLYTKEGRTDTAIEVAASAWKYASVSGPARSKIAALRQYGLVTLVKGHLRISDLAMMLILRGEETPEYKQALKRAALTPALFSELRDSHPDASEDGLRHHLIVDKKFTKEGANRVIQSYQATIELANLDGASYDADEDETVDEPGAKLPPVTTGKYTLPISPTESITLWGNFPITPTEWEHMINMIEGMRLALVTESTEEETISE